MLGLNSKREFVIIQDHRKDGEIWVSLKQQEVKFPAACGVLSDFRHLTTPLHLSYQSSSWQGRLWQSPCTTPYVSECTRPHMLCVTSAQYALAWHRIRQMSQEDIKVEAEVLGANRGGLIVSVGHIRGFMPGSHLSQVHSAGTSYSRQLSTSQRSVAARSQSGSAADAEMQSRCLPRLCVAACVSTLPV